MVLQPSTSASNSLSPRLALPGGAFFMRGARGSPAVNRVPEAGTRRRRHLPLDGRFRFFRIARLPDFDGHTAPKVSMRFPPEYYDDQHVNCGGRCDFAEAAMNHRGIEYSVAKTA